MASLNNAASHSSPKITILDSANDFGAASSAVNRMESIQSIKTGGHKKNKTLTNANAKLR